MDHVWTYCGLGMQVVRTLLPQGVLCAGSLQAVAPATAHTSYERCDWASCLPFCKPYGWTCLHLMVRKFVHSRETEA